MGTGAVNVGISGLGADPLNDEPLPDAQSFLGVMERTIDLLGTNVSRSDIQRVAEALHALRWEFRDYGIQVHVLLNDAGEVRCATDWAGPVDSVISMDATTFHKAAFGKQNFGTALLMGKLRVEGISASNLSRFSSLLKPFLENYRQACAELYDPAR